MSKAKNATVVLGDGGQQTADLAASFNDTLNKLVTSIPQQAAAPAPVIISQQPATSTTPAAPASSAAPATTTTTSTFPKWILGVTAAAVLAGGLWLFSKNK